MYTTLRNQLLALSQGYDPSECVYKIDFVLNDEPYKGELFPTPDAALQWCYDDALKHGLPYLKLAYHFAYSICYGCPSFKDRYELQGFSAKRTNGNFIIHRDVRNNMIWSMDDTGTCGRDDRPECLAYPNEKPQYEFLDYFRQKEIDWCRNVAHTSVIEHEIDSGYSAASRDLEDVYALASGTRPPNSLPLSHHTYDICKTFCMKKFAGLKEGVSAKDLTDEQLMMIIRDDGGTIPQEIIEQVYQIHN